MTEKQMLVQHFYNCLKQFKNANKLSDPQELGVEVKIDMSSVKHAVLFTKLSQQCKNIDQLKTFIKSLPDSSISDTTIDYIFENAVLEENGSSLYIPNYY